MPLYTDRIDKSYEREYLFIDGGCLRSAVRSISEQVAHDAGAFTILYPLIAEGADKVFLYDAISAQDHVESIASYEARVQSEHEKFDAIRSLDRFHVSLGEIKGKGKNRRQKQVDVRLSVDMLTHTFRGNMTRATLLAGDDDFIPLVEALVREGMNVTIFHPQQASETLLSTADNRRPLNLESIYSILSRDGITRAFEPAGGSSGGSELGISEVIGSWNYNRNQFALARDGSMFYICRRTENEIWERKRFIVKDSPFDQTITVLAAATGWNICDDLEKFIEEMKLKF